MAERQGPDDATRIGTGDLGLDLGRLRRVALFQGLAESSLRSLLKGAVVRRAEDRTPLFMQGDDADHFYVLLDGWVRLYRLTGDGEETLVTIVAPGETFAEAAMFAQGRFPVCAEAIGPASILVVGRRGFVDSLSGDPQIAFAMLGALSSRLRHLVERLEQIQSKSAPERLADFLARLCPEGGGSTRIDLPFSKALLAQRLGMRPETLSRAMGALRRSGVTAAGGRIEIADVERLRAFCTDAFD